MRAVDQKLDQVLISAGVVPVLTSDDPVSAVAVAKALCAGGLNVLEVVLRTSAALDVVKAIRDSVATTVVGVGTVLSPEDYDASERAGANFIVSPGFSRELLERALATDTAYVPAVSTPAEVMQVMQCGFELMKFFPAEQFGGPDTLAAFEGPFKSVKFLCTGGIKLSRLHVYKQQRNVSAVGASFMVPANAVSEKNWIGIERLAREAKNAWEAGIKPPVAPWQIGTRTLRTVSGPNRVTSHPRLSRPA